ncbi:3-isopropylmalate dehydratase small subunit [Parasulfitobacter algicola]|uniref:3-isopropylmalate dehydratase n=1 Tax=Parasulfitobacter algicola TaxID=2614809 RepID=A0ABX2IPX4_9RHOB|nr:3-isopropylmalate dehydratase small subunit [Sulfitobacter algicola]NSX54934.1 3-isopropylmalate dehydratase small subunit [Sulfitobacter algicola]
MEGWRIHTGTALALPFDNLDTDQLIPARFMSQPRDAGYDDFLLYDMRRDAHGNLDPGFPLNCDSQASILVVGRNFGSGSSREAAVYALVDAGVRAVIAPSFGDIFASNAVNNGLLPARVSDADGAALLMALSGKPESASVDLETGRLMIGTMSIQFALDGAWRIKLINGWDDIDLTQRHQSDIQTFSKTRRHNAPWVWPHETH